MDYCSTGVCGMRFPFEFVGPIKIEETKGDRKIISGTLLIEGTSSNGHLYEIDQMRYIAETAIGAPLRIGTAPEIDPNNGRLNTNAHDTSDQSVIGKITKTILDPIKRKIKFWGEIWNTAFHPDAIKTVKQDWGISVGGWAQAAPYVVTKLGKFARKIMGLVVNHVQLIPPIVKRGQKEAKVEYVEETLSSIPTSEKQEKLVNEIEELMIKEQKIKQEIQDLEDIQAVLNHPEVKKYIIETVSIF